MRPVLLLVVAAAACVPQSPAPARLATASDTAAYVASVAKAERRARKIKMNQSYDRITGRTIVSMPLLDDGALSTSAVRLLVSYDYAGDSTPAAPPSEVLFTVDWEDYGGGTQYLEAPAADFLVDDSVRFSAKGRDYQRYVDRSFAQIVFDDSTFRQRVVVPVGRDELARMTEARTVEAKLTSGQGFALKPEHILALRRLEERMGGAR